MIYMNAVYCFGLLLAYRTTILVKIYGKVCWRFQLVTWCHRQYIDSSGTRCWDRDTVVLYTNWAAACIDSRSPYWLIVSVASNCRRLWWNTEHGNDIQRRTSSVQLWL